MRAIILVAACAAIVGVSYGMYSPIVPVFAREELGADFSQVGLIGMANYLPYMFAPFFVGMMLDRTNKAYLLSAGIGLNIFSIFMLSYAHSVPEAMAFRGTAGVAHALFWPSCEVLISANAASEKRIKWIALFTAAWVGGFMAGPLAGRLVLDYFSYRALFELSALAIAAALVPSLMLLRHGRPVSGRAHRKLSMLYDIKKEVARMPAVSSVILYYAITFGVILAVYPAYMKAAKVSDQDIELLFFAFGISRFATLPFVQRLAARGRPALVAAVALTAIGMLLSFAYASVIAFAIALVLMGISTSIFYPITFSFATRGVPLEKLGSKLGIYETLFGIGWTAGPIAVGLSSDAFGAHSPYLAFSAIGAGVAGSMMFARKKSEHVDPAALDP
jgi:MFS family permease